MVLFRGRTPILGLTAALVSAAIAVAGCGSSSSKKGEQSSAAVTTSSSSAATSSSAAAESSKGGSAEADVAYASEELKKYEGIPAFTFKGPKFDAAKAKGKTILDIPLSHTNPFNVAVAEGEESGAKQLGIKFETYWTTGAPSEWAAGIEHGIATHVNVINLQGGVDPSLLGPQIKQAQAAGIAVVAPHLYDLTQKPVDVNYSLPDNYKLAAALEADGVIKETKAKADVYAILSNEVVPTSAIKEQLEESFSKHCVECKITFVNVPVTEWGTKIEPDVQSALVKDPNINYVIPIYDSMSPGVVSAIKAAGRVGKVFISTFNGTPFVMKMLQDENIVKFEIGEDLGWEGWAYIDGDARVLAGEKIPQTYWEETPLRVFTKANVNEAGVPPKLSTGYGNAFESGYKSIWGI